MELNNSFEGGMSDDTSKIYQNNKTYLKAENLRPITVLGESNGSLVNIRGNNCEITFPEIKSVYKLNIYKSFSGTTFLTGTVRITINGQTTSNIVLNEYTTPSEVSQYIKLLPNCYNNVYNPVSDFSVAYDENFIYIYQNAEYKTCSIIDAVEPAISITLVSGNSTIAFNSSSGEETSQNVYFIEPIINDSLVIIGSTYINETFYLFTCSSRNESSNGQIWEMTYNETSQETTIKLIYYNLLNFTKEYSIPPSACIGRYETDTIQRIYWSDNNNPVRSINVKDPNLMSLSVDIIDLTPSIEMSVPTLKEVLDIGAVVPLSSNYTYQSAYRLKKSNGAITNYSIASNIVNPLAHPINDYIGSSVKFASMNGDVGTSNKVLIWEISGVDSDYDIIEFIVIIRESNSEENYNIYKYDEQVINGNTSFTTRFLNDEDVFEEISLDEFLIENTPFTHVKTIEQKDNRLFFGNVRNGLSNYLETFDTRAFRFNQSSNVIRVKNFETDSTATSYTISNDNYNQISENTDSIPVYNLGMSTSDDPEYSNTYKYQKNSTIIGGTGPNISYKFGTVLLMSDSEPTVPSQSVMGSSLEGTERDNTSSAQTYYAGYRRAGEITYITSPLVPYYNNLAPNQKYYTNNFKNTMGVEYFNGTFRSYELNEIYRFGIRFYYKNGNGYFVKWIGDIKFPNYNDSVAPGLGGIANNANIVNDFRSMYYTGSKAYSNVPYIQFDVNIPEELSQLISGYQIVRVKRRDQDMSITGHGLINQVTINSSGGIAQSYNCPGTGFNTTTGDMGYGNPDNNSFITLTAANDGLTFHPFKNIVDKSSSRIELGDKLIVTEKYGKVLNTAVWPLNTVPTGNIGNHWWIRKFYNLQSFIYGNLSNSIYTVNDSAYSDPMPVTGSSGVTVNGFGVQNKFQNRSNTSSTCAPCVAISLNTTLTWSYFGSDVVSPSSSTVNGTSKLLAIHFKPSTLKTQYFGRTYLNRSQNEYISCGAFYPVSNSGNTQIKVWGGDIYYGILDVQKYIKEYDPKTSSTLSNSQTWYFPTHSKYNVDLRSGAHVNSDLNDAGGISALYSDEYVYNYSLSFENTLYKMYPKPFDFNINSNYSNRIYWSDIKFNGETSDSWTSIPILNYYDVDGNYGGITSLISLNNNMYFIQESAIGVLLINQQSLMSDQNNQTLKVGIGEVLNKHVYNNLDVGSKHQWSIYKSDSEITFIDIRHKKIFLFNGQTLTCISDVKGQRGFMNKVIHDDIIVNDNPIINKGILTTYDYENNEFLYTFHNKYDNNIGSFDERYTISYCDLTNAFGSFYSFTPYIYINNHNKLYSSNTYTNVSNGIKVYMHNIGDYGIFYGNLYQSRLKVNVNENPLNTKVFDNLSWISESTKENDISLDHINNYAGESDNVNILNDTFSKVRCYNESQNTDWVDLDPTGYGSVGGIRKSEGSWNIQVPRSKVNYDTFPINTYSIFNPTILTKSSFGDRIRGKYMIVDLEYVNWLNNRFIIHNLKTNCRISDR